MFFYFFIFLLLLAFSARAYRKKVAFIPHFILLAMITLKGSVGCDLMGYLNRYENFDSIRSFQGAQGEFGWYLVEWLTNVLQWDYQMYTVIAGVVGVGFIAKAQGKIKYLGFLVFIYQMIFVQLGLSGLRQFIAVSILIYATTIYIFENQKSFLKFIVLILLAASFHISVLAMVFILPFVFKLKKWQLYFIILLGVAGLTTDALLASVDKYDSRYLEGSSISAGAWIRFGITLIIIKLGLKKSNRNLYYLGLIIAIFGFILGVVNSIALHRFNYYFLPIVCLILIKNYRLGLINQIKMRYVYALSLFYFLFWFIFSDHAFCFIPYNPFFLE